MRFPHRHDGFTLIEQVATLLVAGLLLAMAVPSMARLVTRSATRQAEEALFTAAQLARTRAVMQDTAVLLCPSADGHVCNAAPVWQQGWIVARDADHDGQPDGRILARGEALSEKVLLVGSRGRKHVRFLADGSAAGTNITLLVCPRGALEGRARRVVISNAGRIREAPANPVQQARCHKQNRQK